MPPMVEHTGPHPTTSLDAQNTPELTPQAEPTGPHPTTSSDTQSSPEPAPQAQIHSISLNLSIYITFPWTPPMASTGTLNTPEPTHQVRPFPMVTPNAPEPTHQARPFPTVTPNAPEPMPQAGPTPKESSVTLNTPNLCLRLDPPPRGPLSPQTLQSPLIRPDPLPWSPRMPLSPIIRPDPLPIDVLGSLFLCGVMLLDLHK